jgi:hypothetical protein
MEGVYSIKFIIIIIIIIIIITITIIITTTITNLGLHKMRGILAS